VTGDPLASALVLGFVLGLQHATDPDHLVAVATIVTRERRFADGALIGILWGLGHTVTLTIAGVVVVALNLRIHDRVGSGLELAVAAMIVTLGVLRLRDALAGGSAGARERLAADHEHGGAEVFHRHGDGRPGVGPAHVHPSRRLLAALGSRRRHVSLRAVGVGAVHGLAGTAAVSLLVLATIQTALGAAVYLVVFGLGTVAGMTALTAVLAWPVSLTLGFRVAHRALGATTGLAAIAFGLLYATRLI
jgi:high-affinity nickel-transport protein